MAASASKPVVRTPPVAKPAPRAPRAPKAPKAARPPVLEAPKAAPAPPKAIAEAPKVKGDRGNRIRIKPESLPEGVVLDRRNPFKFDGRMHGFFQAFLDGKGVATVVQMVARCVEMSAIVGAEDNEEAIHRDLLNRVKDWRDGKVAAREIVATQDGSTYTCVTVRGVPWADAVGRKRK